jgi:hypothetical protein
MYKVFLRLPSTYYITMDDPKDIVGYIQLAICGNEMTIMHIRSNVYGKGIGKLLLIIAATVAIENDVTIIELDDCSDRAWTAHNIYLKSGFHYVNEKPNPEMEATPLKVLRNLT